MGGPPTDLPAFVRRGRHLTATRGALPHHAPCMAVWCTTSGASRLLGKAENYGFMLRGQSEALDAALWAEQPMGKTDSSCLSLFHLCFAL